MIIKTFHTLDQAEFLQVINAFHPQYGAHGIQIGNGRVLIAAAFLSDSQEEYFAENTKTRNSLPHPIFAGTEIINAQHQQELAFLFNGQNPDGTANTAMTVFSDGAVPASATVHNVIRRAAAIHPLMRLSLF